MLSLWAWLPWWCILFISLEWIFIHTYTHTHTQLKAYNVSIWYDMTKMGKRRELKIKQLLYLWASPEFWNWFYCVNHLPRLQVICKKKPPKNPPKNKKKLGSVSDAEILERRHIISLLNAEVMNLRSWEPNTSTTGSHICKWSFCSR